MIADKLKIGTELKGWTRTISEGEFAALSNLTWIVGATHSDKEGMRNTQFGERILGGQNTLAVATALNSNSVIVPWGVENGLKGGVILGFDDVRFRKPVLPGDTLTAVAELIEARDTRDGKRCITKFRESATNQRGELVVEATRVVLWWTGDEF